MKAEHRITFCIGAGFTIGLALVAVGVGVPVPISAGSAFAVIGSLYIELIRQDRI